MPEHHAPTTLMTQHLGSLLLMRWWLLLLLCAGLAWAGLQLHLVLDYPILLALIGGFIALNLFTRWRLQQPAAVRKGEFIAQLLVDVLGLSLLLYFAGGATNPFVSYLLVPLCIGAIALPLPASAAIAATAITCYGLLLSHYIPTDAIAPGHHHGRGGPSLHTWGMGVNFLISACLLTGFLARMAQQLRRQAHALQAQREQVLHAEQLTAIATLAAGTAHDLSTPLGTMKVAAEELAGQPLPNGLDADAKVIVEQVQHCQSLLTRLRTRAQSCLQPERKSQAADDWLSRLIEEWRLINPQFELRVTLAPQLAQLQVAADITLGQALINLLNNAAHHTGAPIQLDAQVEAGKLLLYIHDQGTGLPEQVRKNWGQPFNSSGDGMGLGVYLSNATLERHGGAVHYESCAQGHITRICLPGTRAHASH